MAQLEALGINVGYVLMQVLLFIILMNVLKGYLYAPLTKSITDRREKIEQGMEDARQAAVARQNAEADAAVVLDEARAEAAKVRSAAADQAGDQAASIIADAKAQAADIIAKANEDAGAARDNALGGLRGQVASLAMAAANRVVGESMDEKRQHSVINDFFSKVPASVSSLAGASAVVTSAVPLTDKEKAAAAKAIKADNVDFKVDPDIMGGLIVRVGDQVVDESVASQMGAMRSAMQ